VEAIVASSPSLKKNFSWTIAGNTFYALTQWVVLVLLARFGSQSEVGQFALAMAISAPVFAFLNLKLRSVQATDALDEYSFNIYLAVRMLSAAIGLTAVILIVGLVGYRGSIAWAIVIIALAKAVESLSDIFHGLQQRYEHMEIIARSLTFKGIGTVIGFVGGYLLSNSLIGGVAGLGLAWTATLVLFDIPKGRLRLNANIAGLGTGVRPDWDRSQMLPLTLLSLPLGATVAIGSLSSNVPRYFAGAMLSTQQLGIFAAVSYVLVGGNLIMSAISQSATPRLARLYRTGSTSAHLRLTIQLLILGAAIGVAGIGVVLILGEFLLELVYGPEYGGYGDLFLLVMINAALSYSYVFLGTALTSMKRFKVQLPVHLVGLVVLVLASIWLVPREGLNGVAWAMIVSNLVQAIAYAGILISIVTQWRVSASEAARAKS
jgi:O-antigen/teichoic acid export membrane protein